MQNLIRKSPQGKIKYFLENLIMSLLLQDLKWRVYFLPQLDRGYTYNLSKWGGERRNVSSFTTELHLNSAKQLVIILSSAQIMCHLFELLRFQKLRNIFTVLLSRELKLILILMIKLSIVIENKKHSNVFNVPRTFEQIADVQRNVSLYICNNVRH